MALARQLGLLLETGLQAHPEKPGRRAGSSTSDAPVHCSAESQSRWGDALGSVRSVVESLWLHSGDAPGSVLGEAPSFGARLGDELVLCLEIRWGWQPERNQRRAGGCTRRRS
jgi:hypothetical protein